MFKSPNDIAFVLFGFPVYYYGIVMSFAVFAGFCVTNYLYNKYNVSQHIIIKSTKHSVIEHLLRNLSNIKIAQFGSRLMRYDRISENLILDITPYIIIIGIIGARLYYCLVNYFYYFQHPIEIFFIRQGGLSIHGAIVAGALGLFYFSKRYKVPFLFLTDIFLCGTILAQSIGRWGNFFNSEAFGLPCDLPWKLYIPISHRPLEYINYEYFHPTFLYESLLDFGIFVILMIIAEHSGKLLLEGRKEGKQEDAKMHRDIEAKSLNDISFGEISQPQTDTNRSIIQPFNLSTDNYLPPHPSPLPSGEGVCSNNHATIQPFNLSTNNKIAQQVRDDGQSQIDKILSPYRPIALSPDKYGKITALYLILYAIVRIIVEQFRIDSALNIFGIPVAQIVSGFMILCGVLLFLKNKN